MLIVDLHLKGNLVIVVGSGNEGVKKVNSLLTQDCEILVISNSQNSQIEKYTKQGKIKFKKIKLKDASFLSKYKPYLVMATTSDRTLNRKIVEKARKMKSYAYASDDPEISDFAHPSVINIADTVQVAVSTGGSSPAMARKIKLKAESFFKKNISSEDIYQIKLQKFARSEAKQVLSAQLDRKKFLYTIMIKDLPNAFSTFKKHSSVSECVIIQTCNRIELFATSDNHSVEKIKSTWASLTGLEENVFRETLEVCENKDAYEHLLKLTSGLESLVVGEEQIIGQIKESISVARQAQASGKRLNKLFDRSIKIGTRIRNSTGISRGGISLGSMAVKLAEENVDDIKSKHVLLIGTGEAATMVAKSLKKRGYTFNVTSRTLERSIGFSQTLGGKPIKFEDILSGFNNYDVIFVATTAPYFLVTFDKMKQAMKNKKSGTMILDLSNPRTVDEKVAVIPGIKLMNIDQIAEMVDKNMKKRKGKISAVENIISEEVPIIEATMKRLDAEPLVKDVFTNADFMRIKELQKALQMLGETDEKRIRIIDDLTKAVVESIVSAPMNNLRKASEQGNPELLEIAQKLFNYQKKN